MRILAMLVLVAGVVLGGGAAYYAWKFTAEQRLNTLRPEFETVRILVARQTLAPGARLDPKQLAWAEWPAASVPDGAFSRTEVLFGDRGELARYAMRTIERGEPILSGKVSEPGGSGRFIYNLPPGMRAVSIPVDTVSIVSGFVSPGDRVDIQLIHGVEGALVSRVILTDVEILAVDQSANTEAASPRVGRTVTVAVKTEDAQRLGLASQMGRLSLMLRGLDTPPGEQAPAAPVDSRSLDGVVEPGAAPPRTVTVRRGGETQSVPIR